MRKILILSLSIFLLASCKPGKRDLKRIADERRKLMTEKLEDFTSKQFPGYTKNSKESYVLTNDSIVYMGVEVVENEKEIAKVNYWATFDGLYSTRFRIEKKGVDFVMKE